jgi:RNA polymerase sigma-70 factor, ECF subfamily
MPPTDRELIARFVEGDSGALEELARRHESSLLGLAYGWLRAEPDLARDAVQESWVRVIRYAKGFDGRSEVKTWLYRIVLNQCRTLAALRRRRQTRTAVSAEQTVAPPAELADDDELRAAVAALDPAQRDVVLCCYHAGLTHAEAAEILDIPAGTLKSRLHAALELLRRRLAREVVR